MRLTHLLIGLSLLLSGFTQAWHLRTAPFDLFGAGTMESRDGPFVNVEADFMLNDQLTLGPTLTVSSYLTDWQFGMRANWFAVHAEKSGWFSSLEGNVFLFSAENDECTSWVQDPDPMFSENLYCEEYDYKSVRKQSYRLRALQNFRFQFEMLSVDLGIGSQVRVVSQGAEIENVEMRPAYEFSLGWLF